MEQWAWPDGRTVLDDLLAGFPGDRYPLVLRFWFPMDFYGSARVVSLDRSFLQSAGSLLRECA